MGTRHGRMSMGAALGVALLASAGCERAAPSIRSAALETGHPGQGTHDGDCLRGDTVAHQPTAQTLRDCSHPVPGLTNEPDLQHHVAGVGGAFVATAPGRDGQDHWYVCGMHGTSPSGSPSPNAPFRCRWLGKTSTHLASLRDRKTYPL